MTLGGNIGGLWLIGESTQSLQLMISERTVEAMLLPEDAQPRAVFDLILEPDGGPIVRASELTEMRDFIRKEVIPSFEPHVR